MSEHVTKYFQDWIENNLDEERKTEITEHLSECSVCQDYFQKLKGVLEPINISSETKLTPDPFLPIKIESLINSKESKSSSFAPLLRWSFASIGIFIACMIGITLGNGIAKTESEEISTEVFYEYYDAFSQSGIGETWEYLSNLEGGVNEN
ncbi:MAG: zf-HC2 domain-containing protein [Ignavibacteriaceae bacterium]